MTPVLSSLVPCPLGLLLIEIDPFLRKTKLLEDEVEKGEEFWNPRAPQRCGLQIAVPISFLLWQHRFDVAAMYLLFTHLSIQYMWGLKKILWFHQSVTMNIIMEQPFPFSWTMHTPALLPQTEDELKKLSRLLQDGYHQNATD